MRRLLLLLAGLVLAGCAATDPPAPAQSSTPAPPVASADPAGLIGLWTLVGSSDDPGGLVRIDEHSVSVFRHCAVIRAQWEAGVTGLFVAYTSGYQVSERGRGCRPDTSAPDWTTRATAFRAEGADRVLLDQDGRILVRLTPGGKPKAVIDLAPADREPPVVTDEIRRSLSRKPDLPAGLAPAGPALLAGRWVPAAGATPGGAHVELSADGSWTGSDGCNRQAGRWVGDTAGTVLAVAGAQTQIGCENVAVPAWFDEARAAGFDGDVLVLLDADGRETGRLKRAA
jgi:hypothetical protein